MSLKDKSSMVVLKGGQSQAGSIAALDPNTNDIIAISATQNTPNLTRVNESGLIEGVGANVLPRSFDNGGCGDLRIYNQSTNLEMDNIDPSNWYNSVLTPVNIGAFDLNATASWGKYTQSGTVNNFGIVYSTTNVVDYTISTYFHTAESGDYLALRVVGAGVIVLRISDNTVTSGVGIVNYTKVIDTSIATVKRVVFQVTGNGSSIFMQLPSSTGVPFVDDGNTVTITAFQVEAKKYETPVIFTSGSTETRDNMIVTQSGLSGRIGQTEGGFFIECELLHDDGTALLFLNRSIANGVLLFVDGSGVVTCRIYHDSNVVTLSGGSVSAGDSLKIGVRYKSGDSSLYLNGVQLDAKAGAISFTAALDTLELNNTPVYVGGEGAKIMGNLAIFDTAPTDTQLEEITTP